MLSTLPGQGKGEWGGMGMVFTVGRDADEDAGCSGKEEPWSRTLHFRGSHFSSHYCHERARNPCATRLCLIQAPMAPFLCHTSGTWEPAILCSNGPKPAYSLRITSTPVHLLQSGLRHWQVCKDLGLVGWMSVCVCEVP